jgi:hypothetical protein
MYPWAPNATWASRWNMVKLFEVKTCLKKPYGSIKIAKFALNKGKSKSLESTEIKCFLTIVKKSVVLTK